jgi:hypothetical protein
MDLSDFNFARKLENSNKLEKSPDLFSAQPINSNLPAASLEEIRAELRTISGLPLRDDADPERIEVVASPALANRQKAGAA